MNNHANSTAPTVEQKLNDLETKYSKSRKGLYKTLAGVLELYREIDGDDAALKEVEKVLEKRKIVVKPSTDLVLMILKCVCTADRGRAYEYAVVLRKAIEKKKEPAGLPAWIKENHGIDAIRRRAGIAGKKTTPKKAQADKKPEIDKKARREDAYKALDEISVILGTVTTTKVLECENNYVLAVLRACAEGEFDLVKIYPDQDELAKIVDKFSKTEEAVDTPSTGNVVVGAPNAAVVNVEEPSTAVAVVDAPSTAVTVVGNLSAGMAKAQAQNFEDLIKPRTIDDVVFPNAEVEKGIRDHANGSLPTNVLFWGPPGTGKTTCADLLVKALFGDGYDKDVDYHRIDCSMETSIDVVRDRLDRALSLIPFSGKHYVLFDEIDSMSPQAQKSLKGLTNIHKGQTLFLATTNHIDKIDAALWDRFDKYEFDNFSVEKLREYSLKNLKKAAANNISDTELDEALKKANGSIRALNRELAKLALKFGSIEPVMETTDEYAS